MTALPATDAERRQEVVRLVKDLDTALGRPPFPNPSDSQTLIAARALRQFLHAMRDANKLNSLEKEPATATTLPILCASLPEGSADKKPCLQLYRTLLSCLAPVCLFSTFPVTTILATAEGILPFDDATLFELTASSHALTAAKLRRFLGLESTGGGVSGSKGKKEGKKNGASPEPAALSLSTALVDAILKTPLEPPLVTIFTSLFNTPEGFLSRVGADSALATRLLSSYSATILGPLTSACLVPSLCSDTVGYLLDVVTREASADTRSCLDRFFGEPVVHLAVQYWSPESAAALVAELDSMAPTVQGEEALGATVLLGFVLRASFRLRLVDASLRRLCVAVLKTASVALAYLTSQATTHVTLNPAGDLELCSDTVDLVLQPLHQVVAYMGDEAVRGVCERTARESHLLRTEVGQGAAALCGRVDEYMEALIKRKPAVAAAPGKVAAPAKAAKGDAKKAQNKSKSGSAKIAVPPQPVKHTPASAPCLLCDVLERVSRLSLVFGALSTGDATRHANRTMFKVVEYVLKYQRRAPTSSCYAALLDLCALMGWQTAAEPSSDPSAEHTALMRCFHQFLPDAVRLTGRCAWASSFFRAPSTGRAFVQHDNASAVVPLLTALLNAATVHREEHTRGGADADRVSTELYLSPLSRSAIAGLIGHHVSSEQLRSVAANATSELATNGTSPLLVFVQKQLDTFVSCDSTPLFLFRSEAVAPASGECSAFAELTVTVVEGLQRLRDALSSTVVAQHATMEEREHERAEEQMRVAQLRIAEAERLAVAKKAFDAARTAREEAKRSQHERVREEVRQRQAQRAGKLQEELQSRAAKRAHAQAKMREMSQNSADVRETQRRQRFALYQQRQLQSFRVNAFLEQLGLPTSRILDIQRTMRPRMDTVTPDDLLEYLVTGNLNVPHDMLEDAPTVADAATAGPTSTSPNTAPTTAEGFWDSVMNSHEASAGAAHAAVSPAVPQVNKHSLHFRVSPFLDLFCYEGGDEYGTVPDPLPQIKLSLARRVVPPYDVKEMGFDSLDAVFRRLADRGVVTLQSGFAQLTVVGFRYHFPFHNAERMLEIRLQQNRDCVRAMLLAQRERTRASHFANDDDGEADEGAADWDEEEEEEEAEEEDDEQVLPDDEFGI